MRFRLGTRLWRFALVQNAMREFFMDEDRKSGHLGALLGGLVAIAAIAFMLSGGEWGGKKKVDSDDDLPPVITSTRTAR
jgi:hypothetical protein